MHDESSTSGLPVMPSFLDEGHARYCRKCTTWRHSSQFINQRTTCEVCRLRERKSHAKHITQRRVADVARTYGLTTAELLTMRQNQAERCAICGEPETRVTANGLTYALCVDHNHTTGKVRGLLCYRCNQVVGWLELSSPQIVADAWQYLARYP